MKSFQHGYCFYGNKCTFAHGEGEWTFWTELHNRQTKHLKKLREEQKLTESFSERVMTMIKSKGEEHVVSGILASFKHFLIMHKAT